MPSAAAAQRVLLCGPNSPELAAAYFAVHAAGGVAVLLDADIPAESARWIAEDAEARLALCCAGTRPAHSGRQPWPPGAAADEGELLASPQCALEDPADLIYTSGTTGRKKGVLLSHANLAHAALNINAFLGTCLRRPGMRALAAESFLRPGAIAVHGPGRPFACCCKTGCAIRPWCSSNSSTPALPDWPSCPPGFDLILRMTKDRLGDAREHLRYIEIGSAAMRPETKQKLLDLLPHTRICHHYGLTEASRAAFIEYHADRDHLASIGRPSPNVEMAVHDDEGRDLPDGQAGRNRRPWRHGACSSTGSSPN